MTRAKHSTKKRNDISSLEIQRVFFEIQSYGTNWNSRERGSIRSYSILAAFTLQRIIYPLDILNDLLYK